MGPQGGGSTQADMRNPKTEEKTVGQWNQWDFLGPNSQFNKFGRNQPLMRSAESGALGFWDQLPALLSQFSGLRGNYDKFLGPTSGLSQGYERYISPVIASGGALTPEGLRTSQQQARAAASASGNIHDIGANVNEVLNNEQNREARLNQALSQSQSVLGQQSGAASGVSSLLGQQQGMQTGGLNQLLGVMNAKVGNFTGLQNPILGYLGNLFSGNQQASIANAQISAQQGAAGDAKMGSSIGGALSAVGSIAAMVL